MHDVSFFLLKNWLPVGASAILFFGIGLLLARFIWGRYTQRLANAIEENMNLASQWSALGASQQDLFKKIRVRWQADRDAYESVLAEKDARLSQLGEQLRASGTDLSTMDKLPPEEIDAHRKVKELESALTLEKAEAARLREELDQISELPILPFAVKGHAEGPSVKADDTLQIRLQELEQDLIDTHDELHKVRADYEAQVKLVESLEEKLIALPEAKLPEPIEPAPPVESADSVELVQLRALMEQRGREVRHLRAASVAIPEETLKSLRAETQVSLELLQTELDAARVDFADREKSLLSEQSAREAAARESLARLETRIGEVSAQLREKETEMVRLESDLRGRVGELEDAQAQIAAMESLGRRKATLQAELNDACHELYDVRRALNQRIERIAALEQSLEAFSETDSKNAYLERELEGARSELASALESLAETRLGHAETMQALEVLRLVQDGERTEAKALSEQWNDTRRDLSEVRIALAAKTEEYQTALAQMEELEAIIGDRTAEVNDLSAELRQQRDASRQLKNTLAETQGELEALSEESRVLNAGAKARIQFNEELQGRIAALESALAERYRDLNFARVEGEEHSRNAKHFESKAIHLESELTRRTVEFDASDRRIATVERALDAAEAKIGILSSTLEESETSLGQLREELQTVSREKEENLRNLDRATRRITELEEAARVREALLAELERDQKETGKQAAVLDQKIERFQTELVNAREELRISQAAVSELEDALRASDERTLHLSHRLDEKESESTRLAGEIGQLQSLVDLHSAGETEARVRLSSLESELEAKLAEFQRDQSAAKERHSRERANQATETEALRERIHALEEKLAEDAVIRESNQTEVEALREKLASRVEEIRDLQNRISEIMMQRASRDTEVALLKEKLLAMETAAAHVAAPFTSSVGNAEKESEVSTEKAPSPYAMMEGMPEEEGIPLDDLPGQKAHHQPLQKAETAESRKTEPLAVPVSWNAGDEEYTVFFNQSSHSLTRAEMEKVDRCARSIRQLGKKVEVVLIGYTGAEGSPDFTESLSARRADAVRERLIERGVSVGVLKVRSAGQDRRFSDWKARRVEMILSPVAAAEAVN